MQRLQLLKWDAGVCIIMRTDVFSTGDVTWDLEVDFQRLMEEEMLSITNSQGNERICVCNFCHDFAYGNSFWCLLDSSIDWAHTVRLCKTLSVYYTKLLNKIFRIALFMNSVFFEKFLKVNGAAFKCQLEGQTSYRFLHLFFIRYAIFATPFTNIFW